MEETIRIMCPNLLCRKVLGVPTSARGKTVRCKGCSTAIRIPDKPGTNNKPDASAKKSA
jgi:hypothetical protein